MILTFLKFVDFTFVIPVQAELPKVNLSLCSNVRCLECVKDYKFSEMIAFYFGDFILPHTRLVA